MYVKTFQAPNLLELMEAVRSEMGPLAVLISVRRIELPSAETVLEGAAAIDREALPPVKPTPEPAANTDRHAAPPVRPAPIRPHAPEPAARPSHTSRIGSWLRHSTQSLLKPSNGLRTESNRLPASPLLVLVGPLGSGKTAMAAKIATYLRNREELPIGLITTDLSNTNGALRLRDYAERLHIPMTAAQSASELREAIQRWGNRGPLVLDTPGLVPEATETVKTLLDWLRTWIPSIETHLVLNIGDSSEHLTDDLDSFRRVGCQKLILTHMDRRAKRDADTDKTMARVLSSKIPISFLGTGTRVPEDLAIPTRGRLMPCLA
jgi:flagellar biosynthesis GTPase FlhF